MVKSEIVKQLKKKYPALNHSRIQIIVDIIFDAISTIVDNGVNYQTMLDLLKGQDDTEV